MVRMHKIVASTFALTSFALFAAPLRVMPLGDSITESYGWHEGSGYRAALRQMLVDKGFEVDMVGSVRSFPNGFCNPDVTKDAVDDCEHDGHGGWQIDHIRANLPLWFRTVEDPHVILLLIGTNDFGAHNDDDHVIDRYDALLDELAAYQPGATIIAASLLPRDQGWDDGYLNPKFNDLLFDRVALHAEKGQKVVYLDLYNAVERGTDFIDNLHPNANGYRKMAAAWCDAICEKFDSANVPARNAIAPVDQVLCSDRRSVTLYFNQPLGAEADVLANYTSTLASFEPEAVSVAADRRSVTVRGRELIPVGVPFTLRIAGLAEVPVNVQATGAQKTVDEARLYRLAWSIDLPERASWGDTVPRYAIDNREHLGPYTRVAYYLELEDNAGALSYCWVSMDKFTDDPRKLGIPTRANSGDVGYEGEVRNLKVRSNVATAGSRSVTTGRMEFFGSNYGNAYNADSPFGYSADGGYGSMQILDMDTPTPAPILCVNNWGKFKGPAGDPVDVGIGWNNSGKGHPDWTFANNATNYRRRLLQAYVLEETSPAEPPRVVSAGPTVAGNKVIVRFDRPIATSTVLPSVFGLSDGTTVLKAEVSPLDPRDVVLTLGSAASAGVTLTFDGLAADRPSRTPGSGSVVLSAAYLPLEVAANVSASATDGYRFVYAADLPFQNEWRAGKEIYTYYDRVTRLFDRAAYYMELVSLDGTTTNWVWVSSDKFSAGSATDELAIPFRSAGTPGRFVIDNIGVESNMANITPLTPAAEGVGTQCVAEFFSSNYSGSFGWDDRPQPPEDGHGCMQLFSCANGGEVLFSFSGWGHDTGDMAYGIGTNPSGYKDWTLAENSDRYSRRRLYAFVRPSTAEVSTRPPASVLEKVPESTDYSLLYTIQLTEGMKICNGGSPTDTVNVEGYEAAHLVNNAAALDGPYSRVAYLLELTHKDTGAVSWIWTAFDAISDSLADIDIPTPGHYLAQNVSNLDVDSNVPGIVKGKGLRDGNIEFWPCSYRTANENGNGQVVPGARGDIYDFGDNCEGGGDYGSMQVHNHDPANPQTLWAVNGFNGTAGGLDVGIGNSEGTHTDWTLVKTAALYSDMKLHVMIIPDTEHGVSEQPVQITSDETRQCLAVSYRTALAPAAMDPNAYRVDGVRPVRVRQSQLDLRDVYLDLAAPLSANVDHMLVTRFAGGDKAFVVEMPRETSAQIKAGVPEFGEYVLVNDVSVKESVNYSANGADYRTDLSRFTNVMTFDRIAYALELQHADTGRAQWVWVSMDAFTDDLRMVGVPTFRHGGPLLQQTVKNLHVYAGASDGEVSIPTGELPTGLIEFTYTDYTAGNYAGVLGASETVYDCGDDILHSINRPGHGSMQIHDPATRQVLLSLSSFGTSNLTVSRTPGLCIGNTPDPSGNSTDGTFLENAPQLSVRDLRIYVRPTAAAPDGGFGPAFLVQPQLVKPDTRHAEISVYAPNAVRYQWRCDGAPIVGANGTTLSVVLHSRPHVYDVIAYGADGCFTVSEGRTLFCGLTLLIR